jgi:hypothetical protein
MTTTMPALAHVALQPEGGTPEESRIHGEVIAQIAHEHAAYTDARLQLVQDLRELAERSSALSELSPGVRKGFYLKTADVCTRAADMLVVRRTLAQWVTGGGHLVMGLVGPGIACECEIGHNHMDTESPAR